jgi:hypothetical protein
MKSATVFIPSNRRRHGRLALSDLRCSLGRLLNISGGGMAVEGRRRWAKKVKVTFGEGDHKATVLAVRIWSHRAGLLRRAVGYRFIDPPGNLLECLNGNAITALTTRVI